MRMHNSCRRRSEQTTKLLLIENPFFTVNLYLRSYIGVLLIGNRCVVIKQRACSSVSIQKTKSEKQKKKKNKEEWIVTVWRQELPVANCLKFVDGKTKTGRNNQETGGIVRGFSSWSKALLSCSYHLKKQ